MNPPYDDLPIQQDNYTLDALTMLTQAAMQKNSNNNSSPSATYTGSGFPTNSQCIKNNSALTNQDAGYHIRAIPATTSISSSTISNHPTATSPYHLPSSVSNLVGNYTRSHRAMENPVFNPTEQIQRNAYMNHPYQPTYPSNLGILNAERYDDGRGSIGSHHLNMMSMKAHGQMQNLMPFGMLEKTGDSSETRPPSEEPGHGKKRRKRVRDESPSFEDDEEARKRPGETRVDPKDETAADRRRTQIRMAQRAYRHRKETTISSLEKQVQELRSTNEEMNNIFITLYDFAIGKGLLQREPEFGQQLQSTTQRFLALAKQSASDDHAKDGGDSSDKVTPEPHIETNQSLASRSTQRLSPPMSAPGQTIVTEAVNSWGGYSVSKDTSSEEEEVLTENSHQDAKEAKRFEVPLPTTHSYFELSFARRVHRATMEQGYRLLTMKNPPPGRFQEVFGFCLTYETKEESEARFRKALGSSAKEPLQEWRAPFVHLGGAGTYYPNQGPTTDNELMPKFRTGFSMGPFSASFTPTRESINSDMRCTIPGFEGEFFDSNDVEGYLKGHGFNIHPAADFITGQIDLEELSEPESSDTASADSKLPPTPQSPAGARFDEVNQDPYNFDYFNCDMSKEVQIDSAFSFMPLQSWNNNNSKVASPFNITGPIFDATNGPNSGDTSPMINVKKKRYTEKCTVTIRVETLIRELAAHARCLGRTPGFRRADVNAAIVTAAREAGV
ncbi:hypothetical protein DID88_003912 [Monilinia fructigena]|uniref:BZIP domain-containing protein n=1 Tax=Monilinia fructigena TaxID=38457 RepID=A0A395ITA2_9HELO|nr:hypothetical protein DID88_003912 [Monilinia fructigena]